MRTHFKRQFALTDDGARALCRSTTYSFLLNLIHMGPAILLMLLADELLAHHLHSRSTYLIASLAVLAIMYVLLALEYESLYSNTYRESAQLRSQMAALLADLPLSYFSRHDLADLAQTFMGDVEAIEHALSHAIAKTYALCFFLPVMGLLLLLGDWRLGLAVIVPIGISFLLIPLSKKHQLKLNQRYFDVLRVKSDAFQETIELQPEIKSYRLVESTRTQLFKQMDESEKLQWKTEKSGVLTIGLANLFSYGSLAAVVLVGVYLYRQGEASLLYVLGYLLAAIKIKDAVDLSHEVILETYHIAPRVQRLREIYDTPTQTGRDTTFRHYDIRLEDVHFHYNDDTPVLNGVSFSAEQNQVTALVGASGSGKSTLLKVIARLYDIDGGRILIDGQDVSQISTDALFAHIAVVFQDVTLFNTSILENIRLGRRDATDAEVLEAARLANCLPFIERLPEGIHTDIGENGALLSGGERQRLSIARAFLKNAPILILDEIASSLDIDNETHIQESLNRLIAGKTVIIISHRLRSIQGVNKIVVLKDGRVEAQGSHERLLEISPTYQSLYEKTAMAEAFTY